MPKNPQYSKIIFSGIASKGHILEGAVTLGGHILEDDSSGNLEGDSLGVYIREGNSLSGDILDDDYVEDNILEGNSLDGDIRKR